MLSINRVGKVVLRARRKALHPISRADELELENAERILADSQEVEALAVARTESPVAEIPDAESPE